MNSIIPIQRFSAAFAPLLALVFVCPGAGEEPQLPVSARDLVWLVSHPKPPAAWPDAARLPEGNPRQPARDLVIVGAPALPAIQVALDDLERNGASSNFSKNAGWLLLAYARIRGRAAVPTLRALMGVPQCDFLLPSLDRAIAVSLELTSYVTGFREHAVHERARWAYPNYELIGPGAAMDLLVRVWESGERISENALGPDARPAFFSLLAGRTWAEMRNALWKGASSENASVGYKFQIAGAWGEPQETLGDKATGVPAKAETYDINTDFTDRLGNPCGSQRVKFSWRLTGGGAFVTYMVDEPDMEGLLRLIASCASRHSGIQ